MILPTFIDIDGTLTAADRAGAGVVETRVARVREMIGAGQPIVIWSALGTEYARAFCAQHDIQPLAAIGKPSRMVDDNPTVRPRGRMPVVAPEDFF